jgi:signal transduction histidine kinase/ActR/RegA family two-component response regulator
VKGSLFGSDLWKSALDKYAQATGLSVELFETDAQMVLGSTHLTPLAALFREYRFEPGLFAECARRCLGQTYDRPAIVAAESHGLTVVGTSLVLEGEIVGAAVAGYALAGFSQVSSVQRWARSAGLPFERLWSIMRQQAPVPERRLLLHGELLQVLGDALLRENYRTRQYEDTVVKLEAASAARNEFLAVLSHELRTPLTPIAGWASVLKKSGVEQVRRAAESIERNALLQSQMIDDLLDMSRIRHGAAGLDLEILDLAASVRAAAETSAAAAESKALSMEISGPDEPLLVEGDAGRLQQVFANIISNAVKFTPAGGSVRISLRREAGDALVRIRDTGRGIAPEFLPYAFEIFRQQERSTHRSNEGLGIGLSLVKKLTELHKGTVSIESAGPGRGTEVSVRLPLAARLPEAAATPAAAEPGVPALAGLSVLVVEDSADARESLRELLDVLGAKVCLAGDGREALDMMAQDATFDVVLCDLLMPHVDGFEFIGALDSRSAPAHPPIIAVSGLASDESLERTLRAGFAGHVQKPFSEGSITAAIQAALSWEERHASDSRPAPGPSTSSA